MDTPTALHTKFTLSRETTVTTHLPTLLTLLIIQADQPKDTDTGTPILMVATTQRVLVVAMDLIRMLGTILRDHMVVGPTQMVATTQRDLAVEADPIRVLVPIPADQDPTVVDPDLLLVTILPVQLLHTDTRTLTLATILQGHKVADPTLMLAPRDQARIAGLTLVLIAAGQGPQATTPHQVLIAAAVNEVVQGTPQPTIRSQVPTRDPITLVPIAAIHTVVQGILQVIIQPLNMEDPTVDRTDLAESQQ